MGLIKRQPATAGAIYGYKGQAAYGDLLSGGEILMMLHSSKSGVVPGRQPAWRFGRIARYLGNLVLSFGAHRSAWLGAVTIFR